MVLVALIVKVWKNVHLAFPHFGAVSLLTIRKVHSHTLNYFFVSSSSSLRHLLLFGFSFELLLIIFLQPIKM